MWTRRKRRRRSGRRRRKGGRVSCFVHPPEIPPGSTSKI